MSLHTGPGRGSSLEDCIGAGARAWDGWSGHRGSGNVWCLLPAVTKAPCVSASVWVPGVPGCHIIATPYLQSLIEGNIVQAGPRAVSTCLHRWLCFSSDPYPISVTKESTGFQKCTLAVRATRVLGSASGGQVGLRPVSAFPSCLHVAPFVLE